MKTFYLNTLLLTLMCCFTNGLAQQIDSNKEVAELIHKKRMFNQKYSSGYEIQLYYGNEKEAKKTLSKFRSKFPGTKTKLGYYKPFWNVKVGSYRTTLEADRQLKKIRRIFSGAIRVEKQN